MRTHVFGDISGGSSVLYASQHELHSTQPLFKVFPYLVLLVYLLDEFIWILVLKGSEEQPSHTLALFYSKGEEPSVMFKACKISVGSEWRVFQSSVASGSYGE